MENDEATNVASLVECESEVDNDKRPITSCVTPNEKRQCANTETGNNEDG